MSKVESNISSLGAAGATTGKQISEGMNQGATGMQKLAREFTVGEGSIRTMNAEVRSLQGSIFGDTRAASEFLATLPKIGEAMELAFPIFGAVALAGVLVQAGEKAYELWNKYLSLTSAAKEYNAELQKAKDADFGDAHSIETTTARIKEATAAIDEYKKHVAAIEQNTVGDYLAGNFLRKDSQAHVVLDDQYAKQRQVDKLKEGAGEQQHQATLDAITLAYADNGRLSRQQQITLELNKQKAINHENASYKYEEDKAHGNTAKFPSGEEATKNQIAKAQAERQFGELQKTQEQELMQLRNEAINAQLHGSALYKAQEEQAIEDLKFKDMDSVAARNAVHAKFHAEEMQRLQDETDATQMIQARAAMAGMTGIQKTQAQGDIDVGQIRGDKNLSDEAKEARVAAAQQETQAQIVEQQRSFSQEIDQIADQSATHQISGFARIRADETKNLDELQKKFQQVYGGIDKKSPEYRQGSAELARGQAAIEGAAGQQTSDLARKNAEETDQIEAEARSKFLSAEKQKTAAIENEYQERLQKYQAELDAQEISDGDYRRRKAAAEQERNAEMVEAATAARQKMAGEFDSFFRGMNHPMQELEHLGDKAASQAAAAMVQKLQTRGGRGIPQQSTTEAGFGGMFGNLFGLNGRGRHASAGSAAPPEIAAAAPVSLPGHIAAHGSESKMLSVATAQIHVDSAQIAFGGTVGGGKSGGSSTSEFVDGGSSIDNFNSYSRSGVASGGSASSPGGGGHASMSTAAAYLGGAGLPSRGGAFTGIANDVRSGIGFTRSAVRSFGGGRSSAAASAPGGAPVSDSYSYPGALNFGGGSTSNSSGASFASSTSSPGSSYGGSMSTAPGASIASSTSSPGSSSGGSSSSSGTIGGAGSASVSQAPPSSSGGTVPASGSGASGVISDLQKGTNLAQSAAKDFGSSSGAQPFSAINGPNDPLGLNVPGSSSASTTSSGGMLNGGGIMANAAGAATGALGLFSAYEGSGGVGGAMSGAMSGMQVGMAVGGPVGAAIGAAGGAILGAVGPGGAEKARVYDLKQVRPRITADQDSYAQGGMDYLAAYSDLESADMAAKKATDAMGAVGQSYYQNNIKPELKQAEGKFTSEQKAGRSMYTASAAQYDIGTDFVPRDGMAMIHQGERIVPSDQNERITQAIEGGGTMPTESSSGGDTHLHVHAIDAKSSVQFLMANKHNVRSALNASLAENSGGSDA